ncbi:ATP-binding cassette domain-containing protein [Gluconacetobacter azotocaptans]|uniref:ATP-binding cassette domain-containing protein n=1 Tax=Gluconacetobacter azotocaptans TaxID=142834 RepID=UPI001C7F1941|nr:ATP-binding cassette domain-containing protein [Gluconacetobacter azotocaptans]
MPAIECRNIGYRYGKEDTWVFRNVNLQVPIGESLAITGPSGCGKSTLLAIMMGLIQPEEGEVLWNGSALGPENRDEYRLQIAGVLQDDVLLSGSIFENISGFDEDADREFVFECAKNAQIFDDIQRMPMKFETLSSEMGHTLSGGQRQRVVLARAFYRRPSIFFLDEATSNLDDDRSEKINEYIDGINATKIIISHRNLKKTWSNFSFH